VIALYRLKKFPLPQRLGKLAKIFGQAERDFALQAGLPAATRAYLADAAALGAEGIPEEARPALAAAAAALRTGDGEARRGLNTVRHIFLTASGRSAADWDFDLTSAPGSLDPAQRQVFPGMQVYLEDIRSPFNVGAMFRTAESFGVEKLWLSPLCADPGHPRARRTAMGCVEVLPWERSALPTDIPLFALETGGTPVEDFPFPSRGLMIVGAEELGSSPAALTAAAASLGRVSIRTWGAKGSLNVASAVAIALHAWSLSLSLSQPPPVGLGGPRPPSGGCGGRRPPR